jgi:hypothetical protein
VRTPRASYRPCPPRRVRSPARAETRLGWVSGLGASRRCGAGFAAPCSSTCDDELVHTLREALAGAVGVVVVALLVGGAGAPSAFSASSAMPTAAATRADPVRSVPTLTACVAAWNHRAMNARRAAAGRASQSVNLIVEIGPVGAAVIPSRSTPGNGAGRAAFETGACVLAVPTSPHRLRIITGGWLDGSVIAWKTTPTVILSGVLPRNARLSASGVLTLA